VPTICDQRPQSPTIYSFYPSPPLKEKRVKEGGNGGREGGGNGVAGGGGLRCAERGGNGVQKYFLENLQTLKKPSIYKAFWRF
jgi:hypothetical protein